MRVLVGCEFSGIVRDAFIARGHDAWSCDLLPSERPGPHIQNDILKHLDDGWDLGIFHPPCTDLAASGARWFEKKKLNGDQARSIGFFNHLVEAGIYPHGIPKWACENPIGIMSKLFRKPDQIIQPFHYGHEVQKATCLWLKNLPKLAPTNVVDRGMIYVDPRGNKHGGAHTLRAKVAYSPLMLLPRNEERWKIRSRTFQGIADAMADQWGGSQ